MLLATFYSLTVRLYFKGTTLLSNKTWGNIAGIQLELHLYWVSLIVLKGAMVAPRGEK